MSLSAKEEVGNLLLCLQRAECPDAHCTNGSSHYQSPPICLQVCIVGEATNEVIGKADRSVMVHLSRSFAPFIC